MDDDRLTWIYSATNPDELRDRYSFRNIIGNSAPIQQVYEQVARVARHLMQRPGQPPGAIDRVAEIGQGRGRVAGERPGQGDRHAAEEDDGQEIGQVGASPGNPGVGAPLEGGDQHALPAVTDRGDDGLAHAPDLVGDPGTGTRVILAPWSMAAIRA